MPAFGEHCGLRHMVSLFNDVLCLRALRAVADIAEDLESVGAGLHHIGVVNMHHRRFRGLLADQGKVGVQGMRWDALAEMAR